MLLVASRSVLVLGTSPPSQGTPLIPRPRLLHTLFVICPAFFSAAMSLHLESSAMHSGRDVGAQSAKAVLRQPARQWQQGAAMAAACAQRAAQGCEGWGPAPCCAAPACAGWEQEAAAPCTGDRPGGSSAATGCPDRRGRAVCRCACWRGCRESSSCRRGAARLPHGRPPSARPACPLVEAAPCRLQGGRGGMRPRAG